MKAALKQDAADSLAEGCGALLYLDLYVTVLSFILKGYCTGKNDTEVHVVVLVLLNQNIFFSNVIMRFGNYRAINCIQRHEIIGVMLLLILKS